MLTCPLPGRHACLDFTSPADVTMHTRTTRIRAASKYNPSDDSDLGPEIICELCDEQAVLFDLVFSLMQLLCPPMETKLSQLYVMEADDFNAAIAAMTSQDNNSSKEGSKKSQKVASFDLGTGNVSSDSEESRALDQSTTEASSGLQEIKVVCMVQYCMNYGSMISGSPKVGEHTLLIPTGARAISLHSNVLYNNT